LLDCLAWHSLAWLYLVVIRLQKKHLQQAIKAREPVIGLALVAVGQKVLPILA
jgi:hypothetical protein